MENKQLIKACSFSQLYRFAGYLAILPTAYATGMYLLCTLILDQSRSSVLALWFIILCAHSCYLLDRAKISDHRQDPADALALPERALLFSRHAPALRALILSQLLVGTIIGFFLHPAIALIPTVALGVVHLYAGRSATPSNPRLKDLPALKAFVIATGHLSLCIAVIWSQNHQLIADMSWQGWLAIAGAWSFVAGDAVLCDIDDHDADKLYSTQSLAVLFGTRVAWVLALCLLLINPLTLWIAHRAGIEVGFAIILCTVLTRKNTNHRDFVDARLLPIVLIAIWFAQH